MKRLTFFLLGLLSACTNEQGHRPLAMEVGSDVVREELPANFRPFLPPTTTDLSTAPARPSRFPGLQLIGVSFNNDGGPLMLISEHSMRHWVGATDSDDDWDGYDEACGLPDEYGLIEAGPHYAISLAVRDMIHSATWYQTKRALYLVGDHWSDDETELEQLLATDGIAEWESVAPRFTVKGHLVLMHPASAGTDFQKTTPELILGAYVAHPYPTPGNRKWAAIGDAVLLPLADGDYAVDLARPKLKKSSVDVIRVRASERR